MQLRSVAYEEARPLVRALWEEIVQRYGGDGAGENDAHPEQFLPPYGAFFVLTEGGEDLACGGVRHLEGDVGEIKRMYVVPGARGRGLSRLVLARLVEHARSVGLRELWLETGTEQPEAMSLYETSGFEPIPPYGLYKDEPDSRCYRVVLARS